VVKIPLKELHNITPTYLTIKTASDKIVNCNWVGNLGPIKNVYYSEHVSTNLLSISQLCKDYKFSVIFTEKEVRVYNHHAINTIESAIWKGTVLNGMYLLDIPLVDNKVSHASVHIANAMPVNKYTMWHKRLNHASKDYMRKLQDIYSQLVWSKEEEIAHHTLTCPGCVKGKMTQKPHYKLSRGLNGVRYSINRPGDLILIDMYFSNVPSRENNYVGLIIVDAYSKCIFTLGAPSKNDASKLFDQWVKHCKQYNVRINAMSTVRSDNGGEFVGPLFKDVLQEHHIIHELVPPYSHVNKAERAIRHLKDNTRALIEDKRENLQRAALHLTNGHSHNAYIFWTDAAMHVCTVTNLMLADKHKTTKQFKFYAREIVDVDHIKVFGATVHVHVNASHRQTWDATSRAGIYLGTMLQAPRSHKVLVLDTKKIIHSESVIFNENAESLIANYISPRSSHNNVSESDYWYDTSSNNRTVLNTDVSLRTIEWTLEEEQETIPTSLVAMSDFDRYIDTEDNDDQTLFNSDFMTKEEEDTLPKNLKDALRIPTWNASYRRELKSLQDANILDVIERPKHQYVNILNWHYIFRIKTDPNTLEKSYKTRATLRGDKQIYGFDYFETFAPVVRHKSLRIALSTANQRGWLIHGMDVDTAFLYGIVEPDEPEILVELPYGYTKKMQHSKSVGRLNKHVYGLKQAPRTWFRTISTYLKDLDFKPTISDTCLFTKKINERCVCVMSVFVDDLVITAKNETIMLEIKEQLRNRWSMKDLGDLKSILGMKVTRDGTTLKLSQSLFISNLLDKYYKGTERYVSTPLDPGTKLKKGAKINESDKENKFPYREIIGALNYLSQCTRPDLTYAVSYLSKFSNCHDESHHKAVKHVLRYLMHTSDEGITYTKEASLTTYGMSDATWGSDLDNSRSVSGHVFFLGGGPISWFSKSQKTVALSSAESEYVAICAAAQEALHLKNFLPEIDHEIYDANECITIYGDNTACIAIAKEPVMHERQKHFDLKLHFIREALYRKELNLKYIDTQINVADLMTKPSSVQMYKRCLPALRGNFDLDQHLQQVK